MASLINGDGYGPVTAQQDADLYAGILGNDLVVLNIGSRMTATIRSATSVRIADGEAVVQGRRIHINAGSYDDFTIPAGEQGVQARYCLGYHIYKDANSNELCETFVQTYSESLLTPASLRDGNTEAYVTLYIVTQDGITISGITPNYKIAQQASKAGMNLLHDGPIRATRINTEYEYTSIPDIEKYNVIGIGFHVHNCHQFVIAVRPYSSWIIISDRPSQTSYIRGGCTVDWGNNRVGIRCIQGTASTVSNILIDKIYGIA